MIILLSYVVALGNGGGDQIFQSHVPVVCQRVSAFGVCVRCRSWKYERSCGCVELCTSEPTSGKLAWAQASTGDPPTQRCGNRWQTSSGYPWVWEQTFKNQRLTLKEQGEGQLIAVPGIVVSCKGLEVGAGRSPFARTEVQGNAEGDVRMACSPAAQSMD